MADAKPLLPARSLRPAVLCLFAAEIGVVLGLMLTSWAEGVETARRQAEYFGGDRPYALLPAALIDALQQAELVALSMYPIVLFAGIALLPTWPRGILARGSKRAALAGVIFVVLAFALEEGSELRNHAELAELMLVGLALPALLAGEARARELVRLRAAWVLVMSLSPLLTVAAIVIPPMEYGGSATLTWCMAIYLTPRFLAFAWTWATADRELKLSPGSAPLLKPADW